MTVASTDMHGFEEDLILVILAPPVGSNSRVAMQRVAGDHKRSPVHHPAVAKDPWL